METVLSTLGEQLKHNEDQRKAADRQRLGELLIDFFQVTAHDEVLAAIRENREPAWLMPPKPIRHLFAKPLWESDIADHSWGGSEFRKEWLVIKRWAREQDLKIETGYTTDSLDRGSVPWMKRNWQGRLTYAPPPPLTPIPEPQPSKTGIWTQLAICIFGRKA